MAGIAVNNVHVEAVTATADPDVPGNAIPSVLWRGKVVTTGAAWELRKDFPSQPAGDAITQAMWDAMYDQVDAAVAADFAGDDIDPSTDPVALP